MSDEKQLKDLADNLRGLLSNFEKTAAVEVQKMKEAGEKPDHSNHLIKHLAYCLLASSDYSKGLRCGACKFMLSEAFIEKMLKNPGDFGIVGFTEEWDVELRCSRCLHEEQIKRMLTGSVTKENSGALVVSGTDKETKNCLTDPVASPKIVSSLMSTNLRVGLVLGLNREEMEALDKIHKKGEIPSLGEASVFVQFVAETEKAASDGGYVVPTEDMVRDDMIVGGLMISKSQFIVMVREGLDLLLAEADLRILLSMVDLVCAAAHPDREHLLKDTLRVHLSQGPKQFITLMHAAKLSKEEGVALLKIAAETALQRATKGIKDKEGEPSQTFENFVKTFMDMDKKKKDDDGEGGPPIH